MYQFSHILIEIKIIIILPTLKTKCLTHIMQK